MILTLGKIKNTKQAKRAITAIQSAFAITPLVGKEVKNDEYLEKYSSLKALCDQLQKNIVAKDERLQKVLAEKEELIKTNDKANLKIGKLKSELFAMANNQIESSKDKELIDSLKASLKNALSEVASLQSDCSKTKAINQTLNDALEDANGKISDEFTKAEDLRFKFLEAKEEINKLKDKIKALQHERDIATKESSRYLSGTYNLEDIDIKDYIVTPKCCNDVVTQNIMKDGFIEPKETVIVKKVKGDLSALPAPKMDGSLLIEPKEIKEWNELIEVKEEHVEEVSEGLKTAFENGLDGRVMIDSEEDYIPPKVDFSVRAIPPKVFIRDKEKNISNSGIKNEEIRELLSGYQAKEIESNVTVSGYKNMYSKVAKYLNRDTLKLIKKIFIASSSNTVKRAYRKPYYDLLVKIHDIITTDKLPIDDIEPQKEADNTKPTVVDKTPLESDTEAIKASIEDKKKQAIDKIENPILTTRDEVFKYAINQVKVAKIEGDDGIPMPFIKVQRLLKDLESFMSRDDIIHLLNILIGDDVFRGNTYGRYIPNIKYWRVLRGIKKGLKTK